MTNDADLHSFISVDVETAGPYPAKYSLLSIGACTLLEPRHTFYAELKPINQLADPQALAISGLSLAQLAETGLSPGEAMASFESWVSTTLPQGVQPVFLAFNAPFDWMFICDYFYRFLGRQPFGHAALDIKAYYMGMFGVSWPETSMKYISQKYLSNRHLTHNALKDAIDQAEIFRQMLAESRQLAGKEITP
jgi:DNA polymerase III epsilon subunit-like protein